LSVELNRVIGFLFFNRTSEMWGQHCQSNEADPRIDRLRRRFDVEETLKTLLEAEADRLCNARRYERSEARRDTRASDRSSTVGAGRRGISP
jgi:hypothetical protein